MTRVAPPPSPILDVAVAGAGPTGFVTALALRRALGPSLRIGVFDPGLARSGPADARASMIAADGRRLLQDIGGWPETAFPVSGLRITDSRLEDALRPTFLELDDAGRDEPFAHMVFDAELRARLRAAADDGEIPLRAEAIDGFHAGPGRLTLVLSSGENVSARLLVAADGARSLVRASARIATHAFAYDQTALVATLSHDGPHGGVAVQHFLPGGPFAMLPLDEGRSSLVWSERRETAATMAAADDAAFLAEVERRAGPDYGAIRLAGARGAFPLRFLLARSFVGTRVALVGDAGHVVHPLAGQGFNLALRDVAALARVVAEAARRGDDIGSDASLAPYERARRFEAASLGAATDGLYRLFSSSATRTLRDVGMGLVDRAPGLKARIVGAATGR
ncbi:FAD-dependent monooxygenase [Chenggangzhangella methanolivorans]|uniref:FAD-dependent monooxygenase n=1 Tax=Chenggangzhangella methanolivorans TaxID=1437009 RepID=A0A9E6RB85_9HYPH|nr:FAD-dependent monooxygenase [Chenggangzhangella methanolivorans]QZO01571.1 FAD-dependent monooxygenase [Chenggangzhangella methanolivorans]